MKMRRRWKNWQIMLPTERRRKNKRKGKGRKLSSRPFLLEIYIDLQLGRYLYKQHKICKLFQHVKKKIITNVYRFSNKAAYFKFFIFNRSKAVEKNELFAPGRMAYCIDLDDELADSDIPTTLIRSKADVPHLETSATLTTNDIVINKLAQILSYLRQGSRHGKKGKKKVC